MTLNVPEVSYPSHTPKVSTMPLAQHLPAASTGPCSTALVQCHAIPVEIPLVEKQQTEVWERLVPILKNIALTENAAWSRRLLRTAGDIAPFNLATTKSADCPSRDAGACLIFNYSILRIESIAATVDIKTLFEMTCCTCCT